MRYTSIITLAILITTTTFGCKKYPENPPISFYPRGERVEGKWKAEKVLYNDVDSTAKYTQYIWEFTRNQSVIIQNGSTKLTGFWTTGNAYKDFIVELDNGQRTTYEIRRLQRKYFWIKDRKTQVEFRLAIIK